MPGSVGDAGISAVYARSTAVGPLRVAVALPVVPWCSWVVEVVGLELGGFRVERVLGRGGMGVVYLATQRSLERRVALKVIAPQLAGDERFRAMFVREARAAAAIDHPHVLPVYETGVLADTVYLAMRYVEGSDLERLLRLDERLAPERAVAIVAQVADALDAAHARGLLHRDVKPANVLIAGVAEREHAYLSDFGLAQQAGDAQTQPGGWAGTLDYVAPELLHGQLPSVASDVYALGCLLFEALTGRVPFGGESAAEKIAARLAGAAPRVSGLPGDLDAVLARALAPDAGARYATAGALAHAAMQALRGSGDGAVTVADAPPATPASNVAALEVCVLGPISVEADGEAVVLGGPQQRGVLAMLALEAPALVSADRLTEGLWGEHVPERAGKVLQQYVWQLRKLLGPEAIITRGRGYALTLATDLQRFTELVAGGAAREALALWRGPALADVADLPFAGAEINRLQEQRLLAAEAAIDHELSNGAGRELVVELQELTAANPLREHVHAQLMRALYRAGRQADALAVHQGLRQRLVDGLGLEPGPELRQLQQEILTQDAVLAAPPALGNLAPARTRFIGRAAELAELEPLTERPGLLTILGPGGAGKTRLATELGRRVGDRFPGGVWMIELAPVVDPSAVAAALAEPFGADARGDAAPLQQLARHLAGRRALLIVDNCEHVIEAAAAAVDELLALAPVQSVVATSREPLAIAGEQIWRIPPLGLPDSMDPEVLGSADPVRLFADRASLVRPGFDAVADDLDAVVEVCRRLDGVPLAIELAAARSGALSPRDIAARLDDRFALLKAGGRSAPDRHRTLRAAIDWSHDLLDEEDRALLRRLSVFRGSFALDAAEHVCGGDLTALVDRSLVVFGDADRYLLLETIRMYAAERLTESGEREQYEARHAACFAALAEAERVGCDRAVQSSLRRLDADRDNLAAALEWTGDHDHSLHVRLVCALGLYWRHTGQKDQLRWIDSALAHAETISDRARLHHVRALLANLGTRDTGRADIEQALGLFIACGDDVNASLCLGHLAWYEATSGTRERAAELAHDALVLAERTGDDIALGWAYNARAMATRDIHESVSLSRLAATHLARAGADQNAAHVLSGAAYVALEREEDELADAVLREAEALARRSEDVFTIAHVTGNRGLAALFLERLDQAEECFRAQLAVLHSAPAWVQGFFGEEPLIGLAAIAAARGSLHEAARLADQAARVAAIWMTPSEEQVTARVRRTFLDPAREALGDEAWGRAAAG